MKTKLDEWRQMDAGGKIPNKWQKWQALPFAWAVRIAIRLGSFQTHPARSPASPVFNV